jgi:hypothetical protein
MVVATVAAIPWSAVDAQPIVPVDRTAEARSLFEQGLRFVDRERWGEALECFRRSRAIIERPNTIYNVGLASFHLGRHNDAIRAFDEYVRLPFDRRDRLQRTAAARMRTESLAAVSTLQLSIAPATSEVRIDGLLVAAVGDGAVREIPLDPGEHSLEATATGYQAHRESLSSLAGSRAVRRIALSPVPSQQGVIASSDAAGAPPAGGAGSNPALVSTAAPPSAPAPAALPAHDTNADNSVVFLEDFRNVPDGSAPPGWTGDVDDYMVRNGPDGQHVFRCFRGSLARFQIPIPPLPDAFRLELTYSRAEHTGGYLWVGLGNIRASLDSRGSSLTDGLINDTRPDSGVRDGVPITVGIERRGSVVRLFLEGREVDLWRPRPEPRAVTVLDLDLNRNGQHYGECRRSENGTGPLPILYRISIIRL